MRNIFSINYLNKLRLQSIVYLFNSLIHKKIHCYFEPFLFLFFLLDTLADAMRVNAQHAYM